MNMIIGGQTAGNGAAVPAGELIKDSNTQNFV